MFIDITDLEILKVSTVGFPLSVRTNFFCLCDRNGDLLSGDFGAPLYNHIRAFSENRH